MNEKEKDIQQEKPLDEKKKAALLRYLAVMFIVAFVFVLLSMIGELRTSEAAISELNASSNSALQRAEQLQDDNRRLETDIAYLEGRIEELEKQLEDLELELAVSEDTIQRTLKELQKSGEILKISGGRYASYTWNHERE